MEVWHRRKEDAAEVSSVDAKIRGVIPKSKRLYASLVWLVALLGLVALAINTTGLLQAGVFVLAVAALIMLSRAAKSLQAEKELGTNLVVAKPGELTVQWSGDMGQKSLATVVACAIDCINRDPASAVPVPSGTVRTEPDGTLTPVPMSIEEQQAVHRSGMEQFVQMQEELRKIVVSLISPRPALPPETPSPGATPPPTGVGATLP